MKVIAALAAALFVAGCSPFEGVPATPTVSNILPTPTVSVDPIDKYISDVEIIFGKKAHNRTALITGAFDTCKNIAGVNTEPLYNLSINAFAEGASITDAQAALVIDAAMKFACPADYWRIHHILGK